jgi:ribonuclease E
VAEVVEAVEVLIETPEPVHAEENPVDEVAGRPPVIGSGVVTVAGSGVIGAVAKPAVTAAGDDDYDMSGYDLSRYEAPAFAADEDEADDEDAEPLVLTGSDDPDAADDDEAEDEDEPVGAGAGRRRSRRGGTRRRTRP